MNWVKKLFGDDDERPADPRTQYRRWARIVEYDGLYTVEIVARRSSVFKSWDKVDAYLDGKGLTTDESHEVQKVDDGVYVVEHIDFDITPQRTRERLLAYLTGRNHKRLARELQDSDVVFGGWVSNPDPPPAKRPPRINHSSRRNGG